jgi:Domain of unknown function (DUF4252)
MNYRIAALLLTAILAAPALAQNSPLLIPPQLEKDLAARASDVTEVTLNKNMLAFAAQFMHGKDDDEAATRHLIEGLDSIYVRDYEFDKDGQFSPDQLEQLRRSFQTPEWSAIVHEQERRSGESSDILVKMVNGENRGIFVLSVEPRDISIVLILGPIRLDQLASLHGIGGLRGLGDIDRTIRTHDRERGKDKDKEKDKQKDKKETDQ